MKIAFASDENKEIDSMLAQHFGRCKYYVFIDIDAETGQIKNIETKENPFLKNHEPGVVPKFISDEKADIIIAGGMGPRAIDMFKQLGVKPFTTETRIINDILQDYLAGGLEGAKPCKD